MIYDDRELAALEDVFVEAIARFRAYMADRIRRDPRHAASFPQADWLEIMRPAFDMIGDVVVDSVIAAAGPFGFRVPRHAAALVAAGPEPLGYGFDVFDPAVAQAASAHIANLAGYSDALRTRVDDWITGGVTRGASVEDLVDEWTDTGGPIGENWARMRARTEITGANNGGLLGGWKTVGVGSKTWRTAGDERVRPTHVELDEVTVGIDDDFDVGGWPAPYPAHDSLPPEERANCFAPSTRVVAVGGLEAVMRRRYVGPMVEIVTVDGERLTVTPHHPCLTPLGWVAAQSLNQGDDVFHAVRVDRFGRRVPQVHDTPPTVEEIGRAVAVAATAQRIGPHGVNFHGDLPDGEVDVVAVDGALRHRIEAVFPEHRLDLEFEGSAHGQRYGEGAGDLGAALTVLLDALREPVPDGTARSLSSGEPGTTLLGCRQRSREAVRLATRPHRQRHLAEAANDGGPANAEHPCHPEDGDTVVVEATQVVEVNVLAGDHDVYNLQAGTGVIVADGIITSNCRCAVLAESATGDDLGEFDAEDADWDLEDLMSVARSLGPDDVTVRMGRDELQQRIMAARAPAGASRVDAASRTELQVAARVEDIAGRATMPTGELRDAVADATFTGSSDAARAARGFADVADVRVPTDTNTVASWIAADNEAAMRGMVENIVSSTMPPPGLSAEIKSVSVHAGTARVPASTASFDVHFTNDAGDVVGRMARTVTVTDGQAIIEHTLFQLPAEAQGQGYATALNRAAFDAYRAAGIDAVTLEANIDVGGYAWARQGFDWDIAKAGVWDARATAEQIGFRIQSWATKNGVGAEVTDAVDSYLARLQSADPTTWPTPYEASQIGWTPGAEMWPGKGGMLGSTWNARFTL